MPGDDLPAIPAYVVLLAGPENHRDEAIAAIIEAGYRVSRRTDSGNLADEGKSWIRAYAREPRALGALASEFGFELRSYSVPIRRLESRIDPREIEIGERLEAQLREDD